MKPMIPFLLLTLITMACTSKTPTVVIVNDKTQADKKREQEQYETRRKQAQQWASQGAKEANETYRHLKVSDYAGKSFKRGHDMQTKTSGSTRSHEKAENLTNQEKDLPGSKAKK